MNNDKIRENSIDESDSVLPYKQGPALAGIVAHGATDIRNREIEVNATKEAVSRRVDSNRLILGISDNSAQMPIHASLLLRKAGRCDHPSCVADRERGIELARAAGIQVPNSTLPPIPSIAKIKQYYPENPVTGKQDRRNPKTFKELRPADKNNPEWIAAKDELNKSESNLYFPEDLLAHHHDD